MSDSESGKGDNDITLEDVKEEEKEEQKSSKKNESSAKENNKRTNNKKNKKEEELKHEEEESEESEDEEVGLLDKPLEVTGSRERKKVERLEISFSTTKEKPEIVKGSGENLGDIPRIEHQIQRASVDDLKMLHRLLFNRPGSANGVRRNIRKFSGFTFTKESVEYKKVKAKLEKLVVASQKNLCEILDLEKPGTKEERINRIMEFLIKPQASSKNVSTSKKQSSKRKGSKKKEKIVKKGGSMKKKSTDSEEDESEELSEKESEEDKDLDVVEEKDDEDMSDEDVAPKKKKGKAKATPRKKSIQVKSKKEKGVDKTKKAADKKAEAKTSKKRKVIDDSDKESSEDEDDAPFTKKSKSPPSDEEIKQLVKKILDDADLEEITMKKVIKQVFDEYPDFDLNDKKDYIKATVKSVIS